MKSKINTYLPAVSPSLSPWIIVILSLCFVNSYNGDFVFDDTEAIVNNVDVRKTPFWDIFQNDFWGTKLSHKQSHKSYRPFTILSFRRAAQYKCAPCPDEVNGKVHKTLVLAIDENTVTTHKSSDIFEDNIRESLKSFIEIFNILFHNRHKHDYILDAYTLGIRPDRVQHKYNKECQ